MKYRIGSTKHGGINGYILVQRKSLLFWYTIAKFSVYAEGLTQAVVHAEYLKEKMEELNV